MSSNPAKAFICANHAEFGKDIQNFSPALTPFADYTCWVDKITVSEKSVIAHIGKMLVGSDKISFGPFISYINGKRKSSGKKNTSDLCSSTFSPTRSARTGRPIKS